MAEADGVGGEQKKLWKACQFGELNNVKNAFDNGASINEEDEKGHSPLMTALRHKNQKVVNWLLEQKNPKVKIHCFDKVSLSTF